MEISLMRNGADSIKHAHLSIEKLDTLIDGIDHNLKDAVIFLNHGIEILLKVMLAERSAALMFSSIKDYQKAKEDLKASSKQDVFEVNPNLQTVSLREALARIEYLCDVEIEDTMKSAVFELNFIRNKLMHFSLTLDQEDLDKFIDKLKFCYTISCDFFEKHIDGIGELIDKARYEYSMEDFRQEGMKYQTNEWWEEQRKSWYGISSDIKIK
ncbi:hypothetical protein ACFTQ7_12940 [Lysinibacillus sp. NPDC056959]|uniref:hypothetical protein n=1 Tax=Lysinibacillus sp. NPDC056959 TaxID=3345981 RepID=UPI0036400840